jgi:hypothetical protein
MIPASVHQAVGWLVVESAHERPVARVILGSSGFATGGQGQNPRNASSRRWPGRSAPLLLFFDNYDEPCRSACWSRLSIPAPEIGLQSR